MNDLQRVLLLVSLGTIALLLCLPACTDAQPRGTFQFDYDGLFDPGFQGDDRPQLEMTMQKVLDRLALMAMSRSGKGPGYTIPRKRQSSGVGLRFFPLDRVAMDEQLRNNRDTIARMERNRENFDLAGRRR